MCTRVNENRRFTKQTRDYYYYFVYVAIALNIMDKKKNINEHNRWCVNEEKTLLIDVILVVYLFF